MDIFTGLKRLVRRVLCMKEPDLEITPTRPSPASQENDTLHYLSESARMIKELGFPPPEMGEQPFEYAPKLYMFVKTMYDREQHFKEIQKDLEQKG